ncbi:MAG: Gfo/Idh/MocA family protein [Verrucomicrobiales bacterium]
MKRRSFIKSSAVFAAPTIVPSYVLGQGDKVAPSNRITLGLIGCGGQGSGDMRNIMNSAEIQTVAVCDPDKGRRENAKNGVEKKYAKDKASGTYKGCEAYNDFRKITDDKGIDAVIIGTHDHWHAVATMAALRNGQDVYCEKPITHLFAEGQAVYKEAAKQKAIFQVGSQQRSDTRFRIAAEIVLNGLIGKVKEVQVGLPTGKSTDIDGKTAQPIPDGLDYDLWCGPSRMLPFHPKRLHWDWRWCLDYGGGQLMDWIGHHNDIAHWGLDMDKSGPIKVEAKGFRYPMKGMYDNPIDYEVVSTYEPGYTVTMSNRLKMVDRKGSNMGTKWIGEDGWVYVTRGYIEASNPEWIRESFDRGAKKAYKVKGGHHRNWVEGIVSRKECICPAETGHRSATPGHIAYVSDKLGRAIKWDPKAENVVGDDEADKLLKTLDYRGDWKL